MAILRSRTAAKKRFWLGSPKGASSAASVPALLPAPSVAGPSRSVASITDTGNLLHQSLSGAEIHPLSRDSVSAGSGDVANNEHPDPPRVLLVEDRDAIRRVLSEALTDAGYAVAEAASGDEALALIGGGARRFDVLLTDVRVPGRLDGFALASAARAGRPDLPVIYMTGWPEIRGRAAAPGGRDAVLRKPFGAREVIGAIERLVL